MVNKKFDIENINRYYKGDYSEEDQSNIVEIFTNNDKVKELEKLLRKQWYELLSKKDLKEVNLDHILYKLNYKINCQASHSNLSNLFSWFSRVAAILILPLMIYTGIHFYRSVNKASPYWVEIQAPAWTRSQFILPDGTHGWLNSNSSIKYNGEFYSSREVTLDGEAFFDVKKDDKKTFKVYTGGINVTVLGTRFNIASYKDEKSIEVVLEEGSLLFEKENSSYLMKPKDYIIYDKKLNNITISSVEPETYSSWTIGQLVFRNDSLDVIARRLERCYNVDVEVRGNFANQPRLRATFIDESIEEVLKLLKLSLPITYEIKPPQIKQDGTYSKTKVIITSIIN